MNFSDEGSSQIQSLCRGHNTVHSVLYVMSAALQSLCRGHNTVHKLVSQRPVSWSPVKAQERQPKDEIRVFRDDSRHTDL